MPLNREEQLLGQIYPPFGDLIHSFLFNARAQGYPVGIFEGLRTFEKQAEYYAKGRDTEGNIINPSQVITYAKPGSSYHQYGLAVDIVFDTDGTKKGFQWGWNEKMDWRGLAEIGQNFGLEAGYFWIKKDPPHFQKTYGFITSQLKSIYTGGGLEAVYREIRNGIC